MIQKKTELELEKEKLESALIDLTMYRKHAGQSERGGGVGWIR